MDLELPRREKPGRLTFNTSTPAIQAWVDDLPLLNTDKTLVLVSSALDQINMLDIPPLQRHEALELLSTSVMCISDALKKAFLGKQLPLQADNMRQATQAIELCNRMAIGYRIVVDDAGVNDTQRTLLCTAIHRALRYLSEVLLTNYQVYVQYPAGLWGIIHALYGLADELRLSTHLVTDNTLHAATSSNIETVYKQSLLLSLACPYRLRQNEIHYIYNGLLEWATASRLYQLNKTQKLGLFAVNLRSDLPPAYRTLSEDLQEGGNWRILDTSEMAHRMQQAISGQAGNSGRASGLGDAQTMQRLMLAWGVMPKRKFSRYRQDASIRLVMGLNSIHRLSAAPTVEEEAKQNGITETFHDHQYLQDPTFERRTRISTVVPSGNRSGASAQSNGTPGKLLRGAYSASGSGTNPVELWKMENLSAGGFCLLWDSESASCAQVGELVALLPREENNMDNRQLGVIRWMKFTPEHGLELGIQLLSPGATAVWAYICETDLQPSNKLQGILLPEIKAIHQPASLLLPSLPFRTGCISTVENQGRKEAIILTRQLENTGAFAQYNFTPATESDESMP
jgi:cyclic-di-GMP-binding protein